MKIIYENCGVKNCIKEEDHRSYRRNFCSCEKETLKKNAQSAFVSNSKDVWKVRGKLQLYSRLKKMHFRLDDDLCVQILNAKVNSYRAF